MSKALFYPKQIHSHAISVAIEAEIAIKYKKELFFLGTYGDRQDVINACLGILLQVASSPTHHFEVSKDIFSSDLRYLHLKPKLKNIVTDICQSLFPQIPELLKLSQEVKQSPNAKPFSSAPKIEKAFRGADKDVQAKVLRLRELHGGSGYTGRLSVGSDAPLGAETFRSDDNPREGLKAWLNKEIIAYGAGAGFSLGELSGPASKRVYDAPCRMEDLKYMKPERLLYILDYATDPSSFLSAFLVYYNRSSHLDLGGNIGTITAANINNPYNRRSLSHLDSVYQSICELDVEKILTPKRATRFLILCSLVLKQSTTKAYRTRNFPDIGDFELSSTLAEINEHIYDLKMKDGIDPDELETEILKRKMARRKPNPASPFFSPDA